MTTKKTAPRSPRANRLKTPGTKPLRKPAAAFPRPAKDLRARAEALLAKTHRDIARMPEQDVQKLVHDLQVHQIELEMQNDELCRAHLELGDARDRYSDLYDFAPCALLTLSERGEVLEANLSASDLLGLERKKLLVQKFTHFIPAEAQDTFYLYCHQLLHSGIRQTCELILQSATGRRLTARLEGIAAKDPTTHTTQYRLSLHDITEHKKAEEALRDMALFPEENASPVLRVTREGTLLYANPAAESLLGHWQCGVGGTVPESVHQAVTAVLESGVSQELELNHAGRDLCFVVTPLGGRNYVNLYGSDITVRKRLHEMLRELNVGLERRVAERTAELRESEARYRSLVTATAQIVWTTNAQGEVLEDIPSWRAFTGQRYDETKGWGWASALHPDDLERTKTVWQHSVATRTLYEIEYRVRRHDGEYLYFAVRGVPIIGEDGSLREWVGACTDITEREAARVRRDATHDLLDLFARKGSSQEYLQGVVAVIRAWADCQCVGIRVVDEHGAIPYNAWVGFDAEFLQVENRHSLKTDDCCCIRAVTQAIEEQDRPLLTPGGSLRCDNTAEFVSQLSPQQQARYGRSFGSAGFASVAVIPICYQGEPLGALHLADRRPARFPLASVEFLETMTPLIGEALQRFHTKAELAKHRDHLEVLVRLRTSELENIAARLQVEIAERRQAQERLQQTADELERSNRDLEQFANVASHDLQEPLRAVSGFVRLLQLRLPDQADAKAAEYIEGACDAVERMERLINGLLAYSRVGTEGGDFIPVDLNALLGDALRNLRASLKLAQAQVTHDDLPTLPADATQITQLFQNLLGNAVKFRGDEPPQIHVGVRREPERWVFSVRDKGIGIRAQHFERIFLLFQRLHTRKQYPGTGIGLAICKKIVERHGGRIWVESQPGQGSTFYFSLPAECGNDKQNPTA